MVLSYVIVKEMLVKKMCFEQGFECFDVFGLSDVFWKVIPVFCCSMTKTPVSK